MKILTSSLISRLCIVGAFGLALWYLPKTSFFPRTAYGPILHEETSGFSKIRVRGKGSKRHLLFVNDSGREGLQSCVDLADPGKLQLPYSRTMFGSLLFRNPQKKVLVVGLGGGGMIQFMRQYLPDVAVDAVEIDPVVVSIARKYFGTTEQAGIRIFTEDAFLFLEKPHQYDVIYMDAFLRPSVDGDAGGKTARLKTVAFLQTVRKRLSPDGILACNLVARRRSTAGDIAAFRDVFPMVKTMKVAGSGNLAVFAANKEKSRSRAEWVSHGKELEKSLPIGIPFATYAKKLR